MKPSGVSGFQSAPAKWREFGEACYTLQVSPEDCTGCTLCVAVCPAKDKANPKHKSLDMAPQKPLRAGAAPLTS